MRGTWKLEGNALEEAVLGSETDSFVFPVISEYQPVLTFSLQEFGCEIVVLMDLESSCHEVGPSFDHLGHGAVVGYARGCPCEYWALSQARPSCLCLCVPTFICPSIRYFIEELSLCDLTSTKRVKRPTSILTLSNSRSSRRMSSSGDSLIVGSKPSPIHF